MRRERSIVGQRSPGPSAATLLALAVVFLVAAVAAPAPPPFDPGRIEIVPAPTPATPVATPTPEEPAPAPQIHEPTPAAPTPDALSPCGPALTLEAVRSGVNVSTTTRVHLQRNQSVSLHPGTVTSVLALAPRLVDPPELSEVTNRSVRSVEVCAFEFAVRGLLVESRAFLVLASRGLEERTVELPPERAMAALALARTTPLRFEDLADIHTRDESEVVYRRVHEAELGPIDIQQILLSIHQAAPETAPAPPLVGVDPLLEPAQEEP